MRRAPHSGQTRPRASSSVIWERVRPHTRHSRRQSSEAPLQTAASFAFAYCKMCQFSRITSRKPRLFLGPLSDTDINRRPDAKPVISRTAKLVACNPLSRPGVARRPLSCPARARRDSSSAQHPASVPASLGVRRFASPWHTHRARPDRWPHEGEPTAIGAPVAQLRFRARQLTLAHRSGWLHRPIAPIRPATRRRLGDLRRRAQHSWLKVRELLLAMPSLLERQHRRARNCSQAAHTLAVIA